MGWSNAVSSDIPCDCVGPNFADVSGCCNPIFCFELTQGLSLTGIKDLGVPSACDGFFQDVRGNGLPLDEHPSLCTVAVKLWVSLPVMLRSGSVLGLQYGDVCQTFP